MSTTTPAVRALYAAAVRALDCIPDVTVADETAKRELRAALDLVRQHNPHTWGSDTEMAAVEIRRVFHGAHAVDRETDSKTVDQFRHWWPSLSRAVDHLINTVDVP